MLKGGGRLKIADISTYQGKVNWDVARKELGYVIFRASIGTKIDDRYIYNANNCGIPFGVYHYVKAGTADEARTEARFFIEAVNQAAMKPTFYFADIEYKLQNKATTEPVCVAFLDELRKNGCEKIGLYINTRYKWAGKAIDMCDAMWIPHYGKNRGDIPEEQYQPKHYCDLWQYTSKGTVAGIKGNVDLSILFGNKTIEYFTGTEKQEEVNKPMSNYLMTASDLANRALDIAKNYKTIYMYAAYGFQVTTSTINAKAKQNCNGWYTSTRIATLKKVANQNPPTWGFDCVNLYKAILWGWTGDESKEKGGAVYAANGVPDTNADGMFNRCSGKSSDFSKIEVGEALWMSGHFGLYVGNGLAVECTPKWQNGVQITAVANIGSKSGYNSRKWTKHGKLPYVSYGEAVVPVVAYKLGDRVLKDGSEGDDVTELQTALVKLGYNLGTYGKNKDGVDGDFGSKTEAAVKKVQEAAGLEASGVFDKAAYAALMLLLTPPIITPEPEPEPVVEEPVVDENPAEPEEPVHGETDETGHDEAPTHVLIIQGDEETLRKLMLAYGGTMAKIEDVRVE